MDKKAYNALPDNMQPENRKSQRLLPIDALRGLALIAMSLDHAGAGVWVSLQAETYGGMQAVLASWPYWVLGLFTNIAAPTFWLLSGVSLALFVAGRQRKGVAEWNITRHLLIRALVIICLDLTVCWLTWSGQSPYLHVLLSIGLCLMVMSFARRLNLRFFSVIIIVLITSYQLALPWIASELSQTDQFFTAFLVSYSTITVPAVEFSIFGWGTLMGLGFLLGQVVASEKFQRPRTWVVISIFLLGLWLILRIWGKFGDLTPYQSDQSWYLFLIMGKTPPAITFLFFNLGISAFLMAMFYKFNHLFRKAPFSWLVACGQVSLFYFAAHLVGYGLLGRLIRWFDLPGPDVIKAVLAWLIGLGILIPITVAYRNLRKKYPESILKYL